MLLLNYINWIMPDCTSQSLPPLRPCLAPHFSQGWGCECTSRLAPPDLGFANPRIISTNPVSRAARVLPSTPQLLVLGQPYPSLPFLHQNANVNLLANMHCPTSPSLILRLVVFMHASLKIAQSILHLRHLLGFDIHSAFPTSVRNTNTEAHRTVSCAFSALIHSFG
jgi:hypothetical protein